MLPSRAMTFNRSMVSTLPTISSKSIGRYFSTLLSIYSLLYKMLGDGPWEFVARAGGRVLCCFCFASCGGGGFCSCGHHRSNNTIYKGVLTFNGGSWTRMVVVTCQRRVRVGATLDKTKLGHRSSVRFLEKFPPQRLGYFVPIKGLDSGVWRTRTRTSILARN